MTNKMDEIIIVVPRKALFENENLAFQGTESNPEIVARLTSNIAQNFGIMRRGDAEENTNFKQPIPYAVIRRGNELFVYERLKGGGETKLHGKLSLGAGGHMNYDSGMRDFTKVVKVNLERELEEELNIFSAYGDSVISLNPKTIGFINDDTNEVGKVHIALLTIIDLPIEAEVTVRETEQLEGSWITLEELQKEEVYSRLENWSQIVVQTLTR